MKTVVLNICEKQWSNFCKDVYFSKNFVVFGNFIELSKDIKLKSAFNVKLQDQIAKRKKTGKPVLA